MSGNDRVRFCSLCRKNVFELSGLSRDEALRLLEQKPNACVRFFVRDDGTVLTDDCPVGLRLARKAVRWTRAKAAATVATVLSVLTGTGVALHLQAEWTADQLREPGGWAQTALQVARFVLPPSPKTTPENEEHMRQTFAPLKPDADMRGGGAVVDLLHVPRPTKGLLNTMKFGSLKNPKR